MALVRGRGNKSTEIRLALILRKMKASGWRRHLPLPGRPDFAFLKSRIVIFVDGCFWHGCPKCYRRPKSNISFWQRKVAQNMRRDRSVGRQLRIDGWKVVRIWEHELGRENRVVSRLKRHLFFL